MKNFSPPFSAVRAVGVPESHLPFSPAIRAGDFVFVSGQASVDATGQIVHDSFEAEFRRSMENVRAVLRGAGLDLHHVVQVRSYVDDPKNLPAYNQLYREYFTQPYPARTTIMNCLGGVIQFEIDVVAYAGK